MDKAVHDTLEMLESIHGKHDGVTGVPTGFRDLDIADRRLAEVGSDHHRRTPELREDGLRAVACRQRRDAPEQADRCGIFSLEMSTQQLIMRLLCADARVDAHARPHRTAAR